MSKPKNPCPSCLFRTRCQQRSYGLTFRTTKRRSPAVISREGAYHGLATDGIVVCKKSLPQSGPTRLGKSTLRQQLAVLVQRSKRPRLRKRDRIFWAWLSRF